MKSVRFLLLVLALCALVALPSCGGDEEGGGDQAGTLSVGLTDASTDDYKAVYVTITEVQVYLSADTWSRVGAPKKTYNLLNLINGVREELGVARLSPEKYNQMRLIIGETPDDGVNILSKQHPYGNYVIGLDNTEHELKIPSGLQTGVAIPQEFTIRANKTTELILDFGASESVVVGGKDVTWLLKPAIKALDTQEWSILGGAVSDDAGNPISGALVSAQISDPTAPDPKDRVIIRASTVTDETGQYKMLTKPGTYNVVVHCAKYNPAVKCAVSLSAKQVAQGYDFALTPSRTGTVSGNLVISGAEPDQYATISFRQFVDCGGTDPRMAIKSLNVINGGLYSVRLPVGFYDAVISTDGKDSMIQVDVGVMEGEDNNFSVNM
jgi:hypothetical protein